MPPLPALALIVALAASSRGAPTAEEQRLFADGLAAWSAGDARAAERAWSQGYGIAHDPAFLVRMGEAEEKAGAPAEALDTYRRYLREAPDASDRADIQQRVARLAPPAAPARDTAEQAHEFGAGAPAALPTTPAPRDVVADAEPARPATTDDADSGWNRYNVTAMSAVGASVLLLGTAGFFAAEASSHESDVNNLQTSHNQAGAPLPYSTVARQYEAALADGRRDAHDARLALIGAAGAAAVATIFFVLDAHHAADAAVAFAPTPGASGGSLLAAWRF